MNKATLNTIAQQHLFIETLAESGINDLDFHSVSVGCVEDALTAAYLAGYAAALRAQAGNEADRLPTQRHTMRGDVWLGEGEASDWTDEPSARTVTTLPIPELELLGNRWQEHNACMVLIPTAIKQRQID